MSPSPKDSLHDEKAMTQFLQIVGNGKKPDTNR